MPVQPGETAGAVFKPASGIAPHHHGTIHIAPTLDGIERAFDDAKYGKPIHLSEVSILSCEPFKDWRELQQHDARIEAARKARQQPPFRVSTPEREQLQAQMVRDFYTLAYGLRLNIHKS